MVPERINTYSTYTRCLADCVGFREWRHRRDDCQLVGVDIQPLYDTGTMEVDCWRT